MLKIHSAIFLQPAPQVIIAFAKMVQTSRHRLQQKKAQSARVRSLLQITMHRFDIVGEFHDHAHPYYIDSNKIRYFVSFSHSDNQVALIISLTPCAIDIEVNDIKYSVVERYFHPNEIYLLTQFSSTDRQQLINILWRLKECRIKLIQDQLYTGMGADMSCYLTGIRPNSINLIKNNDDYFYNHPKLNLTALF